MSRARKSDSEREEAIARLREWIKPGDTIYTVLRHVSRSGMQREIDLRKVGEDGEIMWLSGMAARAMGDRLGKRDGIVTGGCGMDMGFHLVYNLSRTLWPNGAPCSGKGCQSNDHNNRGPERDNYTPRENAHQDGGYTLRHRWI